MSCAWSSWKSTAKGPWAVASIGPAFIGAYLRAHGHDVGFVRVGIDVSDDAVVTGTGAEQPGLVGVSLTTRQWVRARDVIGAIRAKIDVPVIAGGLHPTFAPEAVPLGRRGPGVR